MRRFRTRIFEENGRWFFRWDNVDVQTVCRVTPPLASREEAESRKQDFMDAEQRKNGMVSFESDG
jgi:hypothetical protein